MNDNIQRIMIVEDEAMLALVLEQDLADAGYQTVGPFTDVEGACRAAFEEHFEKAIIDINLRGEMSYPVAQALSERKIPFLFLSGYGTESMPEQYRDFPRLSKPYDRGQLLQMIRELGEAE